MNTVHKVHKSASAIRAILVLWFAVSSLALVLGMPFKEHIPDLLECVLSHDLRIIFCIVRISPI